MPYQDHMHIQSWPDTGCAERRQCFGVREAGVSDKEAQDLSLGNCKVVLCGVLLQTLLSVWCG